MHQLRRITLKDIAREADCSAAVVSTVLNGAKGNTLVSEETRARVVEIAARLDYHPNFASRSLKMSRSRTLGIYVQNAPWRLLSNSYEMQVFKGIERAAREREYDLLLINLGSGVGPHACARKIAEHRVDGVLLIHAPIEAPWIDELLNLTANVVAVDYNLAKPGLDCMMFDNAAAVRLAMEHLAGLGHRRIGFIGSCLEEPEYDSLQRLGAFKTALTHCDCDGDPNLIFTGDKCPRKIFPEEPCCQLEGQFGADYFLALGEAAPTALIGYNDLVAIEAMRQLQDRGIEVPEQMSVIGIDDSERCLYSRPLLSTVYHPMAEMGYDAAMRLIDKTERQTPTEAIHRVFAPGLVVRKSTATVAETDFSCLDNVVK